MWEGPGEPDAEAVLRMTGPVHHQLAHVYRLQPGDEAVAVTPAGRELVLELLAVTAHETRARVRQTRVPATEAGAAVTLAVAAPRGPRMDWLVEKAGELGAAAIQPLWAERGIVPPEAVDQRTERWRRKAAAATVQSRRALQMSFLSGARLDEAVAAFCGPSFIAHVGAAVSLPDALRTAPGTHRLLLAVGPEGGFTAAEVGAAVAQGGVAVGLGPRILRVETAALAMLAATMALLGEWDARG